MKRLVVELDQDLFLKVKVYCAENNISLKEFITKLIKENLK